MQDEMLKQYTRQMVLPQIGQQGQQALLDARVLIVGLGGLGSPAALYLAAAGIGRMTLCDHDRVDLSNLHRQILYTREHLGKKKTAAAQQQLKAVRPDLEITLIDHRMEGPELSGHVQQADLALDCSDNFQTRYLVNEACVRHRVPLISAAAIRLEAQIGIFNNTPHSPCYACLYQASSEDTQQRCSDNGVLGPLVGIAGSMQALEAIKLLTQTGVTLDGKLLTFNAETMEWRSLKLRKDPACPVCSKS
ncbi:MAG TPA: HesA/MoeB/ThiF family protein [Gammaproteobacteria bacterium]|nr:HesA/MoeB/ThiF family protein [Gammaproteobacteria bacterium]